MNTEYKSISVSHTNTECLTEADHLATACWPGSMNLANFSSCHTKWTWGEKNVVMECSRASAMTSLCLELCKCWNKCWKRLLPRMLGIDWDYCTKVQNSYHQSLQLYNFDLNERNSSESDSNPHTKSRWLFHCICSSHEFIHNSHEFIHNCHECIRNSYKYIIFCRQTSVWGLDLMATQENILTEVCTQIRFQN